MSFGSRFLITLLIALAMLGGLALCGYNYWDPVEQTSFPWSLASAQTREELCVPDEATRERIRVIMIDAIEDALHDHVKHLFGVWMKDERGQPERARIGAHQAVKAYIGSRKAVVEWAPKICPDK